MLKKYNRYLVLGRSLVTGTGTWLNLLRSHLDAPPSLQNPGKDNTWHVNAVRYQEYSQYQELGNA